ncbi:methyltransferase domain-containing protein [Bacterioplanoides sp.]|uniref:methyltransferase domain-containing protein n=1 Tax=Bacterioplanoides sp. TaxID=2066072 RepID=UPI003B58FC78
MNRIGNRIKPEVYQRWLKKDSARRLMSLEARWLKDAVQPFRGLHLAYAGIDPEPRFLNGCRCHHRFRIGLPWQNNLVEADVKSRDYSWPLADETLDVVVLQHMLDMGRRPHQSIREACRVLVPNGYLVVVGFNPYSLWGANRFLRTFSGELPWISNPVAPGRLQDWLTLLDLRVEYIQHIEHLWPLKLGSERLSRRFDRVLANRNQFPGNGYLLVARKTVAGITPIRERRWLSSGRGFAVTAPATRNNINV